ncbi:MAG: glucose dehydrogenase [Pelagibacteraceae bacterium]|nr:glucose dehydrogenase [Pelagibacteraceae bacterium]
MRTILLIIILCSFQSFTAFAEINISDYKNYEITKTKFELEKISADLNSPWGMTFIDDENFLITEKTGKLFKLNINTGSKTEIIHELNIHTENRQGGLLDVHFYNDYIYFSYSHDHGDDYSSTAIARGKIEGQKIIDTEILLIAEPKLSFGVHYGSRIIIQNNFLFASMGDRWKFMIAQDGSEHPGSIIRMNLDGSPPKDNPKFINQPSWLPEIYQIGVRNPQGMTVSPFNDDIYISNHGPKGGDFIGVINKGGNYGWPIIGWGGKNYDNSPIGDGKPFKDEYDKPLISWVPSIAPSNIQFYKGGMFKDWNGDLLVTSLKYHMLIKLEIENNKVLKEEIILRGCKMHKKPCHDIGRLRDIEIDKNGNIYIISDEDESFLFKMTIKN